MRFGIRELIYLVILAAVIGAGCFYVLKPIQDEIVVLEAETIKKQAKLQELESVQKRHNDLDEEILKLSEAIARFEERLPERHQTEVILREIWQIASRNRLNPKSINTSREVAAAQYVELPIKLRILGDFDGYYNFVKQIEELPRITRMPQMNVKKMQRSEEGFIEADLQLSIFFAGESEA